MISITTIVVLVTVIIFYYRYFFGYWKSRNVPTLKPNILFGNLTDVVLGRVAVFDLLHKAYEECKSKKYRYIGYYFLAKPILVLRDLDMVKCVLVRDFAHFSDREFYLNEEIDPLSGHLVALRSERWKPMRKLLSPAFSPSKLKMMYEMLLTVAKQLELVLYEAAKEKVPINGRDVAMKYVTDVIGMSIIGIDCNTLKNQNLDILNYGKLISGGSLSQNLKMALCLLNPHVLYFLRIPFNRTDVQKFFLDLTKATVELREKKNIKRNDMMHLLIQLRNNNNIEESKEDDRDQIIVSEESQKALTIVEIAAETLVFLGAANESTSSTILLCLYHFILDPDVQEKARNEVNLILSKHEGHITFEAVMEMEYLETCVKETIRMYPPASTLGRICTKDYTIPETTVVIEKGTTVFVPAYEIMRDHDYFPEPEKFKPERWSRENVSKIPQYSWLGFGEGPHICLGQRLGFLMAKTFIATTLKGFNFSISDKTKLPIEMNRQDLLLNFKNDLFLDIKKI